MFPFSIKPREQQIFLSGKYRLIYHFDMAITYRLLCVPTFVIILAALTLSFLTSLSLPIIPGIPIVQTTLDNGTFLVNGTNSQIFQELKVRFFSLSHFFLLIFPRLYCYLLQLGIW